MLLICWVRSGTSNKSILMHQGWSINVGHTPAPVTALIAAEEAPNYCVSAIDTARGHMCLCALLTGKPRLLLQAHTGIPGADNDDPIGHLNFANKELLREVALRRAQVVDARTLPKAHAVTCETPAGGCTGTRLKTTLAWRATPCLSRQGNLQALVIDFGGECMQA
jgi:hypothetical protein